MLHKIPGSDVYFNPKLVISLKWVKGRHSCWPTRFKSLFTRKEFFDLPYRNGRYYRYDSGDMHIMSLSWLPPKVVIFYSGDKQVITCNSNKQAEQLYKDLLKLINIISEYGR